MAPSTASKLILLEDQTQISIEERNRLRMLNLAPSASDDEEIERSLHTLLQGITALQKHNQSHPEDAQGSNDRKHMDRLVQNYNKLLEAYSKDPNVVVDHLTYYPPGDDEEAMMDGSSKLNKSVRFKDKLEEHEPATSSRRLGGGGGSGSMDRDRAELFMQPYKDDPAVEEEEAELNNTQMYQQQQQLMRDQDTHLGRLGESVRRQHELSIQIDDEVHNHLEMLDDVDRLVDNSGTRLQNAKKKLDVFSKKAKENGSIVTIAILILIFIILIVVLK